MFAPRHRRTLCRSGAAALLTSATLILAGCADDTAGPETGADVADIQEDAADDTASFDEVAGAAEDIVGRTVTVSAEVSEIIGPGAFTLAARNAEELLVVHDGGVRITRDMPVRVTGTVHRRFVPPAEQDAVVGFHHAPFANMNGEPYIEATAIEAGVEFGNEQ